MLSRPEGTDHEIRPSACRHGFAGAFRRRPWRRSRQENSRSGARSRQCRVQRDGGAGGRLLLGPAGGVRACEGRDQGGGRLFRRRQAKPRPIRRSPPKPPAMRSRSRSPSIRSIVSFGKLLQIYFSVAHDPTELNFQGPDEGTQLSLGDFLRQPGAGKDRPRLYRPAWRGACFRPAHRHQGRAAQGLLCRRGLSSGLSDP